MLAVGFLATVSVTPGYAKKQPAGNTVRAVIWPNHVVTIAPKAAKRGAVVFTVKNRDTVPQQFQINGAETHVIEPGASAAITVTFTKPGLYSIALPDLAQSYANDYARLATRIRIK